jgi:hypothetical protein
MTDFPLSGFRMRRKYVHKGVASHGRVDVDERAVTSNAPRTATPTLANSPERPHTPKLAS